MKMKALNRKEDAWRGGASESSWPPERRPSKRSPPQKGEELQKQAHLKGAGWPRAVIQKQEQKKKGFRSKNKNNHGGRMAAVNVAQGGQQ